MIPLFAVKDNELTSLKGEVSSFFEILAPDLEGKSLSALEQVFCELERDLINTDGVFKIYYLNGRLFLNCFSDINLSQGQIIPQNKPLETFLGGLDSKVYFYENYLTCGSKFIRLLSIKDFSDKINFFEAGNFPDFVLSFKKIPKLDAKKKINFKRKLHFSALFKNMRDLESENAYYQSEDLLDAVTTDSKALFHVECFFILSADTKLELDSLTTKTISEFKGFNANLFIEERGLSYFYQTLFPGVRPSFRRKLDVPSDFLSLLIPFHRDFVFEKGIALKTRANNVCYFDLFHTTNLNYNVLITGSSGQGKSMWANKILKDELEKGTKALCLDLGNSFRKNALYGEGIIFSEKFNPLQFKNPSYLKEFVLAVLDEKLPKKEEGRLFEVIERIIQSGVSDFNSFLQSLEMEFLGITHYFSEIKNYFCDEHRPIGNFIYCDLGNYPDIIKAPLIIFLIEYFKNMQGRKVFIFDECWNLLSKNAEYIAECFRTFRKHEASAVAISQNLDDFQRSQLGSVIIQNTYFKFFFKQSLHESEFIDQDSRKILDSIHSKKGVYSEFLLLSESIKKPLRFFPNHLEYQLFTTDRLDLNAFDFYMKEKGRFLSFNEAIHNYIQIKNPTWRFDEAQS